MSYVGSRTPNFLCHGASLSARPCGNKRKYIYMYMYMYMYIMEECIRNHFNMHVHVHTDIRARIHAFTYTDVGTEIHAYVHVCMLQMCAYVYKVYILHCMHKRIYKYIYIYIHMQMYIYICI